MRVLVIPEDPRRDKYILGPILSRLFRNVGKPSARIRICEDPILGGDGQALRMKRLQQIARRYQTVDVFILCVDRDGKTGRRQRLDDLEAGFRNERKFLAVNAWEEIETWVLAGLTLPSNWLWADVRGEIKVSSNYFEPFAAQRGLSNSPGGGRKVLGEEASRRIGAIRQKCREDFDCLAGRLEAELTT